MAIRPPFDAAEIRRLDRGRAPVAFDHPGDCLRPRPVDVDQNDTGAVRSEQHGDRRVDAGWRYVHRRVPHRSVFTAASLSLGYTLTSWIFRSFPPHFAGPAVGTGMHARADMVIAVAISNLIGSKLHHFLLVGAVKLSELAAAHTPEIKDFLRFLYVAYTRSLASRLAPSPQVP
jgi:hypothetical protein